MDEIIIAEGRTIRCECHACLVEFEILLEPKMVGAEPQESNTVGWCPFCVSNQVEEC